MCAEETNFTPQQTLLEVLIAVCPMVDSLTGGSVLPRMPQSRRLSISIGFAHSVLTDFLADSKTEMFSSILVGKTFF